MITEIRIDLYEDAGALYALTVDEHGNERAACVMPPEGFAAHDHDLPGEEEEAAEDATEHCPHCDCANPPDYERCMCSAERA